MSFEYLSFTGATDCYAEIPLDVLAGATEFTVKISLSTTANKNVTGTYSGNLKTWVMNTIFGRDLSGFGKDNGGLCVNNGKLLFWNSPASKGTAASNTQIVSSNATINDGQIHDVAVVSSNGAIDLYCDKVLVAHADNINAKWSDTVTLLIASNGNDASAMQLNLYEAQFWNVALSAEQLAAKIDGTEEGLQAWYKPTDTALDDYSDNDFHATLYGSPAYGEVESISVEISHDVLCYVHNTPLLNSATKVWLTADNYPTEDIAGNLWYSYQNPTLLGGWCFFNGSYQWLRLDGGITLGGKDFTIDTYFYVGSQSDSWIRVFGFYSTWESDATTIQLQRRGKRTSNNFRVCVNGSFIDDFTASLDAQHHFELSYTHADTTVRAFVDGILVGSFVKEIPATFYETPTIGRSNYVADAYLAGFVKEFRVIDGVALHTENFTPIKLDDYSELKDDFNIKRAIGFAVQNQILNAPLTWRYENAGFASLVLPTATTVIGLPTTQSKTSVAFYQTVKQKSFDCDAAKTVWIKFDLYHQGGSAFRIFDTSYKQTGIYRSSNTRIQFYCNNVAVLNIDNVLQTNTLQTWLLRMTADKINGTIELWCDRVKVGEFIGNVNNGVDFGNIYLQSDGANNLFSNVIISNGELTFDDNLSPPFNVEFSCDTVLKIFNAAIVNNPCIAFPNNNANRAQLPNSLFNGATVFTAEVKFASVQNETPPFHSYNAQIFGTNFGLNNARGIMFLLYGGKFRFYQYDSDANSSIFTDRFIADAYPHKVSVRSNADKSLDIFIDGDLISHTDNYGAKLTTESYTATYFAGSSNYNHAYANIFEARFWDKALANDEIFSDIDGTEANLRAWYLPTPNGLADFSQNNFQPVNQNDYYCDYQMPDNDVELTVVNALTPIFFTVRHNGGLVKVPFRPIESSPAATIRWDGKNYFAPLTSGGDISLYHRNDTFYLRGD